MLLFSRSRKLPRLFPFRTLKSICLLSCLEETIPIVPVQSWKPLFVDNLSCTIKLSITPFFGAPFHELFHLTLLIPIVPILPSYCIPSSFPGDSTTQWPFLGLYGNCYLNTYISSFNTSIYLEQRVYSVCLSGSGYFTQNILIFFIKLQFYIL